MLIRIITLGMAALLAGCLTPQPKPGNPEFAPLPPQSLQMPREITGSLYNASTATSLYGDGRAFRVGDILTITLEESTQSSKSAKTALDRSGSTTLTQGNVLGNPLAAFGAPLSFDLPSPTTSFDGEGTSDMSNSLSGNITVTVHQVLPNGVMLVKGEKWLSLNQGDEFIRISGLVRPQDISSDNTVISTKLADARIAYGGTGSLNDTNSAGWLTRFFTSPLMPF